MKGLADHVALRTSDALGEKHHFGLTFQTYQLIQKNTIPQNQEELTDFQRETWKILSD